MKRFFLNLILLLVLPATNAQAATYYVATTGNDSNPGTQAQPFKTIQRGLNVAAHDDTVLVENGTYTGTGNRNLTFGGKRITLRSLGGATNCIVDGEGTLTTSNGHGFVFVSGETAYSILDGFTITREYAITFNHGDGGGIVIANASPTIRNCRIVQNEVNGGDGDAAGGGILIVGGSPTISNCLISGCEAVSDASPASGGGIAVFAGAKPTLLACTIQQNDLHTFLGNSEGGGVFVHGAGSVATLIGCQINGNASNNTGSLALGGGVMVMDGAEVTLTNCALIGNKVEAYYEGQGGGLMVTGTGSKATLTHTIVAWNRTEALRISTKGFGGGILLTGGTTVTMNNGILTGNFARTAGSGAFIADAGALSINYSVAPSNAGWVGNIQVDPLFVRNASAGSDGNWGNDNDDYGDLHLQANSPCINTANSSVAGILPYDMAGNQRILGSAPDMGVFEVGSSRYIGITSALYVDKAVGNDTTGTGTQAAPFQTVTRALSAVIDPVYGVAGIFIRQGDYGTDRPHTTKKVSYRNWGNVGQASIGKP
jgi:hypothetical protein